jgi:hypothetical protein
LRGESGLGNQACKHGLCSWWNKRVAMIESNGSRAIRAPLHRRLELRIMAGELAALNHAHHAMVLAVAAAARWQARLAPGIQRKERLDKRQPQDSQQRDGESFTQCSIEAFSLALMQMLSFWEE